MKGIEDVWRFWPFRRGSRRGDPLVAGDTIPRRRLFGREYTAGIPYALPSDLGERNRLDFQHLVLRQAFKGNYAAPLHNPSNILDVGSGTGRWAKEMASIFPAARVIGLDIKEPVADELSFSQAAKPLLLAQGMPERDVAQLIAAMRREMDTLHYMWPFYIVYGQRPG